MIPWSNGEDAWVTTRKAVVQLHPGSLIEKRSVGVLVARLLGTEEDRVRLPDGPLDGLACSQEATDPCKVGVMGSTPIRSTEPKWADGPMGRHQFGELEIRPSIPGRSTGTSFEYGR